MRACSGSRPSYLSGSGARARAATPLEQPGKRLLQLAKNIGPAVAAPAAPVPTALPQEPKLAYIVLYLVLLTFWLLE